MAIESMVTDAWLQVAGWFAGIVGAIIVLIIGWIAGRIIGKAVSKLFDKIGIDDVIRKTPVGKALEKSGITVVRFFDLLFRWFIYLIAVLAAVDILGIPILSGFMNEVVQYLPRLIGGIFILIFGIVIADWIGDVITAVGKEAKVAFSGLMGTALKFAIYFVVLVMALQLMLIDVTILYIFAEALAWGVAVGIGIGLGIAVGWGMKDTVAKNATKWMTTVESSAKTVEKKKPKLIE